MSETQIDYSRPVGWWCPVSLSFSDDVEVGPDCHCAIPVYLPIPEGQRPLVKDEVDEAEVVTLDMDGECWHMDNKLIHCVAEDGDGWTFNDIARFSAVTP